MTTAPKLNHHAQAERKALADLFDQLGPDAPTLCEGWTTRDLAAHLVIREGRIDAAMGITIPAFAGYTKKVQDKKAKGPWPELVNKVRNGPPKSSMMRAEKVDAAANTIEYFVHFEDVRRAQPDWTPRPLDADLEASMWDRMQKFGPRLLKKAPVGVLLKTNDGRSIAANPGTPLVTVTGDISELLLFAFGRSAVQVSFDGPAEAVAALQSATRGI